MGAAVFAGELCGGAAGADTAGGPPGSSGSSGSSGSAGGLSSLTAAGLRSLTGEVAFDPEGFAAAAVAVADLWGAVGDVFPRTGARSDTPGIGGISSGFGPSRGSSAGLRACRGGTVSGAAGESAAGALPGVLAGAEGGAIPPVCAGSGGTGIGPVVGNP